MSNPPNVQKMGKEASWAPIQKLQSCTGINTKHSYPLTPQDEHIDTQSNWINLKGIPLKNLEQDVQKEAMKWIESHKPSRLFALSNILAVLSCHIVHSKARQADLHNSPFLVFPFLWKAFYVIDDSTIMVCEKPSSSS